MKTTTENARLDLGNNESLVAAIIEENDGTFTAMTYTASRTFKTYAGAVRWMKSRGF